MEMATVYDFLSVVISEFRAPNSLPLPSCELQCGRKGELCGPIASLAIRRRDEYKVHLYIFVPLLLMWFNVWIHTVFPYTCLLCSKSHAMPESTLNENKLLSFSKQLLRRLN